MKRVGTIAIVLALMCFLVGCDSNNFEKANALYEEGNYQEALSLYEKLGNYENAEEMAALCQKEIGMRENADYDFLEKIETSILDRLEKSDSGEYSDYNQLVNTELVYLEGFRNKTFYDQNLKSIAEKYLKGLDTQKEALDGSYYDYPTTWQRGLTLRFEALKDLYEQYGFLEDNADFIASYVAAYDDMKALLVAYEEVDADLGAQISTDIISYSGNYMYWHMKNNTDYTIDLSFTFEFTDRNNVMFDSQYAYIQNIRPGSDYVVEVYLVDPYRHDRIDYHIVTEYIELN